MLVVGFTGHSGSGKTTLIEKVLEALISRDRKVSAIKSSHHGTDIDVPGKDSYRFRQAGAQEVVLVSDQRWALMRETEEPVSLKEILLRLSPVDIVLVEGYKSEENIPHIQLCHSQHTLSLMHTAVSESSGNIVQFISAGCCRQCIFLA